MTCNWTTTMFLPASFVSVFLNYNWSYLVHLRLIYAIPVWNIRWVTRMVFFHRYGLLWRNIFWKIQDVSTYFARQVLLMSTCRIGTIQYRFNYPLPGACDMNPDCSIFSFCCKKYYFVFEKSRLVCVVCEVFFSMYLRSSVSNNFFLWRFLIRYNFSVLCCCGSFGSFVQAFSIIFGSSR